MTLSPAERIAVELMGWRWCPYWDVPEGETGPWTFYAVEGGGFLGHPGQLGKWPEDLTDWNTIRRIEDELARRGWRNEYARFLSEEVTGDCYTSTHNGANNTPSWEACLSATAAQRVEAILRVIEKREPTP